MLLNLKFEKWFIGTIVLWIILWMTVNVNCAVWPSGSRLNLNIEDVPCRFLGSVLEPVLTYFNGSASVEMRSIKIQPCLYWTSACRVFQRAARSQSRLHSHISHLVPYVSENISMNERNDASPPATDSVLTAWLAEIRGICLNWDGNDHVQLQLWSRKETRWEGEYNVLDNDSSDAHRCSKKT